MNWVGFLGWLSVFLLFCLIINFFLWRVNSQFFHNNTKISKLSRVLGKLHPFLGFLLLICGGIHGYLALYGTFMLHTGTILYFLIVLNIFAAVFGKMLKIKGWVKIHRIIALFAVAALVIHLFFRDIIPY